MNTWRVRKLAPWERITNEFPWVIERAVRGRWKLVDHYAAHADAIVFADRQARR